MVRDWHVQFLLNKVLKSKDTILKNVYKMYTFLKPSIGNILQNWTKNYCQDFLSGKKTPSYLRYPLLN